MMISNGSGMDSMGGTDPMGKASGILASLPTWASAIIMILAVLVGAWIAGIIIGKLYASVKYPDPEKQQIIKPIVKIGFLCVIVVCSIWFYVALTKAPVTDLPVDGSEITEDGGMVDDGGNPETRGGGGNAINRSVAIAVTEKG